MANKHFFILPLFLSLLLPLSGSAQDDFQHKKDSLLKAVTATEGQAKLEAYYDLTSFLYRHEQNADSVLKYLYLNEKEAKKQNNLRTERNVRGNIGGLLRNHQLHDKFLERVYDDLDFMAKHEFWDYYYDSARKVVESYKYIGQDKKALDAAMEFYEKAKKSNHSEGIQSTLYAIGFYYHAVNRMAEAEKYFRMSLDEANRSEKVTPAKLNCYFHLAGALINSRKLDECKALFLQWEEDIKEREKDETRGSASRQLSLYRMYLRYYTEIEDDVRAEEYCRLIEEEWPEDVIARTSTTINWVEIYRIRKDWAKVLEYSEKAYKLQEEYNSLLSMSSLSQLKAKALNYLGRADECYAEIEHYAVLRDSLANQELNAQLDELRTQYEVDTHIAEKERNRNYFLFALGGCLLLVIALGIWIYYSRRVLQKNRIMARQIKELNLQYSRQEEEILLKTTVEPEEETKEEETEEETEEGFCPENRFDKLCNAIRTLMLKDRVYRNPAMSREQIIEQLGTNRQLFDEAVMSCFGMSFTNYTATLRMKDAVILLEQSDLPMEIVAEKAGYGTLRTLQRQFDKQYNMSPKDYRKFLNTK